MTARDKFLRQVLLGSAAPPVEMHPMHRRMAMHETIRRGHDEHTGKTKMTAPRKQGGWVEKPDRPSLLGGVYWAARVEIEEDIDAAEFSGVIIESDEA